MYTTHLSLFCVFTIYIAVGRPDNKQNCCRTGDECECEETPLENRFAISMRDTVLCKLYVMVAQMTFDLLWVLRMTYLFLANIYIQVN